MALSYPWPPTPLGSTILFATAGWNYFLLLLTVLPLSLHREKVLWSLSQRLGVLVKQFFWTGWLVCFEPHRPFLAGHTVPRGWVEINYIHLLYDKTVPSSHHRAHDDSKPSCLTFWFKVIFPQRSCHSLYSGFSHDYTISHPIYLNPELWKRVSCRAHVLDAHQKMSYTLVKEVLHS